MNRNKKLTIAAAALTGLLAGSATRSMAATIPTGDHSTAVRKVLGQKAAVSMDEPTTKPDKHSCKGKNACKGAGGCKTGDNGCKGKNSCKGNGGCEVKGD